MTIEPGSIVEMTEAEIYSLNKKIANDYELLVKAAPDLLEACKQAEWHSLDLPLKVVKQLQAAITKATGEQYEN